MGYFDPAYFDPTYFDTGPTVATGSRRVDFDFSEPDDEDEPVLLALLEVP